MLKSISNISYALVTKQGLTNETRWNFAEHLHNITSLFLIKKCEKLLALMISLRYSRTNSYKNVVCSAKSQFKLCVTAHFNG
jgi:hypothetical protein